MSQRVSHERIRQLLAARLDGPLSRNDYRLVSGHLRTCAQCRQVDHDYRAQRAQLRSMSLPIPPRDLWPRTSAALDREVARSRGPFGRRRAASAVSRRLSRSGHSAALAGLLATIGAITALATFEIVPNVGSGGPAEAALPTPFSVADQQLAFVGGPAQNLAVYRMQVNRMCPTSAPDCVSDEGFTSTPIVLPSGIKPRNVSLSPSGQQMALVGGDVGRDVFAVVLMQHGDGSGAAPGASGGQLPGDGASQLPMSGGAPSADGGAQTPSSDGGASGTPDTPLPGDSPALSNVPPTAAVAGLTVLAILDDVHSAGDPPAWSADGSMLAFSAMPADGSHGPDVYVWQPSDTRARAVTSDHNSFFASWSGTRIVASRLLNDASAPAPQIATVVIDPQTLDEQVVDGPQMWLPAVDAGRDTAVVWYGQLAWDGPLPTPRTGNLYVADWSKLDPYAPGNATVPDNSPLSPQPTASPSATSGSPTAVASAPPGTAAAGPNSSPTAVPAGLGKDESSAASPSSNASGSTAPGNAQSSATASPADELPAALSPLDPSAALSDGNVTDWQVRWSSDGQVLGVWIADVTGSNWGRLVVLSLDPQTAQLATDTPLVAPTLARRGFTLGLSRVAFVAPSDETPDGELRVRTWGAIGDGDLRLRAPDVEQLVPAF